jgi:hypothetical protein
MKKNGIRPLAVGSVLFELGKKEEKPSSRIVVSWVYCGTVSYNGEEMHLLVEFSRWFNLRQLGIPITAEHGLKMRSAEQLTNGRISWKELQSCLCSAPKGKRRP